MTPRVPPPDNSILEFISYDEQTGQLWWKKKPTPRRRFARADTRVGGGYRVVFFGGRRYLAHRLILWMELGLWPDYVDHANGDPSDNRLSNLRPATQSQNNFNRSSRAPYGKGVKLLKNGKFQAAMGHGNKEYLGRFDTAEEARQAYAKAATERVGEFARWW